MQQSAPVPLLTVNYFLLKDRIVKQPKDIVEELWQNWSWGKISHVVADKGYDTSQVRAFIKQNQVIPVIPFKGVYLPDDSLLTTENFYDTKIYRKRHIIERFFGRLKENKRIATRFDKLDSSFISFIAIATAKLYNLFC